MEMEVVIVTGLSGAGKSQAVNGLEDQGYYCIDNMPLGMMKSFLELALKRETSPEKIAFVVDVRGAKFEINISEGIRTLQSEGISPKIIFLEASNEILVRRFSETRRVHPVTGNSPTVNDIEEERKILREVRDLADFVIDTSNMKGSKLKREITGLLRKKSDEEVFIVNVTSFGYKHGVPLDADIVMDMRFIPNPYYIKTLKKATGNSQKVRQYVMKHPESQDFIETFVKMTNKIIPCYKREGKFHINIAFGCTGGQHRSVAVANEVSEIFSKQGRQVTLSHRDIKKR